jgi:hypothetical protein
VSGGSEWPRLPARPYMPSSPADGRGGLGGAPSSRNFVSWCLAETCATNTYFLQMCFFSFTYFTKTKPVSQTTSFVTQYRNSWNLTPWQGFEPGADHYIHHAARIKFVLGWFTATADFFYEPVFLGSSTWSANFNVKNKISSTTRNIFLDSKHIKIPLYILVRHTCFLLEMVLPEMVLPEMVLPEMVLPVMVLSEMVLPEMVLPEMVRSLISGYGGRGGTSVGPVEIASWTPWTESRSCQRRCQCDILEPTLRSCVMYNASVAKINNTKNSLFYKKSVNLNF